VLVHLKGHARLESEEVGDTRMDAFKAVSEDDWLHQSRQGFEHAAELAGALNVPIYFVGFSMGGLLGPYLLQSSKSIQFEKMILLSPAISIKTHAHLLKALSLFPGIVIPSSSPEYYRANRGTPIAGYNAFYTVYGEFRKNVRPDRLNTSSLLFVHPRDEFVSESGLRKFRDRHQLSNWKIESMAGNESPKDSLYHLNIDEKSAGSKKWQHLWESVDSLLAN
jgi:esterase/lipase